MKKGSIEEKKNEQSQLLNKQKSKEGLLSLSFLMNYLLIIVIITLVIVFTLLESRFIGINNIFNIFFETSILALGAIGLTIVVVIGEFDISFTETCALAGMMAILLMMSNVNIFLVFLLPLVAILIISYLKAKAVEKIGIPSWIATLAFLVFFQGLMRHFSGGVTIYPRVVPESFLFLGRYKLFGLIPSGVILFLIITIAVIIFLDYSKTGRHIYAAGGNREVAHLVGLPINKLKVIVFLVSGFLFYICGIIMTSSAGSFRMTSGAEYHLPIITATFMGEIHMMKGIPTIKGTLLSSLLLIVLSNGFTMIGMTFYLKQIIQGILLLVTLAVLYITKNKAENV